MARLKHRELGTFQGACACCYADAQLQFRESRFVRTWRDWFDRGFVPQIQRTASCSACGSTYPIRATDPTPVAATRRVPNKTAPRRATDPATLGTGRDWRDTSVPA
jgi:hypothetical protein